MLYLCLSNGLLSVVLDGYDRFDQQSVIRFVEQMYRQTITPFAAAKKTGGRIAIMPGPVL